MAAGALTFYQGDMYQGFNNGYSTRTSTIPTAAEQQTLVDDEQAASEVSIHTTPQQHRNIFVTILAVLGCIFLFSKFG